MWTCPKCQSIYDDAAIECWRCKRPGANGLRVFRPAVVRAVPSGEIVPQPAHISDVAYESNAAHLAAIVERSKAVEETSPIVAPEADAEETEQ